MSFMVKILNYFTSIIFKTSKSTSTFSTGAQCMKKNFKTISLTYMNLKQNKKQTLIRKVLMYKIMTKMKSIPNEQKQVFQRSLTEINLIKIAF